MKLCEAFTRFFTTYDGELDGPYFCYRAATHLVDGDWLICWRCIGEVTEGETFTLLPGCEFADEKLKELKDQKLRGGE